MSGIRQLYYRGSLDFCNYSCPYCPFSKKKRNARREQRDREEWFRFVRWVCESSFCGAVQVVPYGEAMVYEYYWKGLAELSRQDCVYLVGAQSNFSFPVKKMIGVFERAHGRKDKLRLWGTFHPDMTTTGEFLAQCRTLQAAGVLFCVGSVGVPENLHILREMRNGLNREIYFWINKMDGLGRRYTEEEIRSFRELDEYFELELRGFRPLEEDSTDRVVCGDSLLIEGDGTVRPCILCHHRMGNLYRDGLVGLPEKKCTRRICDCFLSYANRSDIPELLYFRPFPAFRMPDYRKKSFFDGTGPEINL